MNWLDRQSFLGPDSDEILNRAVIGLAGLGGGGSHVAQQCAHVGIGNIVSADHDIMEDPNLNRTVGATSQDVANALEKVKIAERLIKGINPKANVLAFANHWQEKAAAFKGCDVIIGGLDSVRAKSELERFCRRLLIPYVDMGMDVHKTDNGFLIAGQVVVSRPGRPCLRCMGVVTEENLEAEAKRYGDAGGRPQVVWPNGVLASTAVGVVVQMLTPWFHADDAPGYYEYDGNLGTVKVSARYTMVANRVCPHHPIGENGDALFDIRTSAIQSAGDILEHLPTPAFL